MIWVNYYRLLFLGYAKFKSWFSEDLNFFHLRLGQLDWYSKKLSLWRSPFLADIESMLKVSSRVSIPMEEIELKAIRSQGAGGQNVNKVSTAVHLFFDIRASSLPEVYKARLLSMKDRRISPAGIVIIKSQEARTQETNREKALARLKELIKEVMQVRKSRRATAPTRGSKERRLQAKDTRSKTKKFRRRPGMDD